MSIVVERTGQFDTLQDAGRSGYRAYGVPAGGWFDPERAVLANILVGNKMGVPCVEMTLRSGLFRVVSSVRLAVVGPGSVINVSSRTLGMRTFDGSVAVTLDPGDSIDVHHPVSGLRSYLAVEGGGWRGKSILGSESSEHRLGTDDVLIPIDPRATSIAHRNVRWLASHIVGEPEPEVGVSFVESLEFSKFAGRSIPAESLAIKWVMAERSDRVGIRFAPTENDFVLRHWAIAPDRLSAPVVIGTIQWTGSELIVLGVAGGTMGGYPVVGHVVTSDLPKLAQLRPGNVIRLRSVTLDQARKTAQDRGRDLFRTYRLIKLSDQQRYRGTIEFPAD